jgi:hypothetical protein
MTKPYRIGQKINLWQVDVRNRETRILKSVIVTITEEKTGVLGHWSKKPQTHQSLRAVDDQGLVYEKHWRIWPESQTATFADRWSLRGDGAPHPDRVDWYYWHPVEAHSAYNSFLYYKREGIVDRIVGPDGKEGIIPLGDVVKCEAHGEYGLKAGDCFDCWMDASAKEILGITEEKKTA